MAVGTGGGTRASRGSFNPPPASFELPFLRKRAVEQAILETAQIEDVDGEPCQPGQHSAHLDAVDVRDRAGAPDRGKVALVDVVEGLRRSLVQARAYGRGGVATTTTRCR